MTGGGSEIPSTKPHRHPGEGGLRPGMTPVLWGQKWPEQGRRPHKSSRRGATDPFTRDSHTPVACVEEPAGGSYRASGSVRRAISVLFVLPVLSFGVFRLAFGSPQECSSLRSFCIPLLMQGEAAHPRTAPAAGRARPVRPAPARDGWAQRQGGGLASRLCRTFGTSLPALALAATYG